MQRDQSFSKIRITLSMFKTQLKLKVGGLVPESKVNNLRTTMVIRILFVPRKSDSLLKCKRNGRLLILGHL